MSSELYTLYGANYKINNGDVLVAECLAKRYHSAEDDFFSRGKKSTSSGKGYKSTLVQKLRDFCGGDYR